MASIKYPKNIESNKDRYAFLYRLQELLQLDHAKKSAGFQDKKISKENWDDYKDNDFTPKSDIISVEICKYRELLKKDVESLAKLSDIVI
jgi:hypothetical protein